MSEQARQVAWNVVRFVALAFLLSAVFAVLIIRGGSMATGRWLYVKGAMWSPAIAVAILRPIPQDGERWPFAGLGWQWRGGYQIVAYATAVSASVIVYALAWTTGLAGFPNTIALAKIAKDFGWVGLPTVVIIPGYAIMTATFGLLPALPSALGEEIGWRGYLVPELSRVCSFTTTSLVTGVIWALWHAPVILFSDFTHGVPVWYGLTCFTVFIMASSVICTWLRLKSGSIWPTVVLHATNNLMLADVLTPLTVQTGASRYFVNEFGCLLPILAIIGAIVCWRRRAEVEPERATAPATTRDDVPSNAVVSIA